MVGWRLLSPCLIPLVLWCISQCYTNVRYNPTIPVQRLPSDGGGSCIRHQGLRQVKLSFNFNKKLCKHLQAFKLWNIAFQIKKRIKKKDWNDSKKILCAPINLILPVSGLLNSSDWQINNCCSPKQKTYINEMNRGKCASKQKIQVST